MKFLIDNNLSFKLTASLIGSAHVRDTVGADADDLTVWDYATKKGFAILTKDNDFDELSQLNGCPPKVIHLNCGNKSTLYISKLLQSYEKEINQFVTANDGNCLMKIFAV